MHIRTKLAAGLISTLFVNLAVGLHGFALLTQAYDRESRLRETSSLIRSIAARPR